MSIEIRWVVEGECHCGTVRPIGAPITCTHRLVTEWGEIEYTEPRPDRGQVGHQLLAMPAWFTELQHGGPALVRHGRRYSATLDGNRRFLHLGYGHQRWTWEMFDARIAARLADGRAMSVLLGRWPD